MTAKTMSTMTTTTTMRTTRTMPEINRFFYGLTTGVSICGFIPSERHTVFSVFLEGGKDVLRSACETSDRAWA